MILDCPRESTNKKKVKIAIRDALIVAGVSFFSNLMTYGYPPKLEAIYMASLSFGLMFLLSLMHSFGIKRPE